MIAARGLLVLVLLEVAGVMSGPAFCASPVGQEPGQAATTLDSRPGDLNLFQMVARADLIVDVIILKGSLKYALVEVRAAIKGFPPGSRIRVAFRDYNWSRPKGEPPIVFPDGQREILFLVPQTHEKPSEKNRDLYTLFRGEAGRIVPAAEGPDPRVDATRRLVAIAALDAAAQVIALHELIASDNPTLRDTAMKEVTRLRAIDPSLYPVLTAVLFSTEATMRAEAIVLIRQMFLAFGTGKGLMPEEQPGRIALARVLDLARNDPAPVVRRAAVTALAAWPHREETGSDLRTLSTADPDQEVRYEAQRALLNH